MSIGNPTSKRASPLQLPVLTGGRLNGTNGETGSWVTGQTTCYQHRADHHKLKSIGHVSQHQQSALLWLETAQYARLVHAWCTSPILVSPHILATKPGTESFAGQNPGEFRLIGAQPRQ